MDGNSGRLFSMYRCRVNTSYAGHADKISLDKAEASHFNMSKELKRIIDVELGEFSDDVHERLGKITEKHTAMPTDVVWSQTISKVERLI